MASETNQPAGIRQAYDILKHEHSALKQKLVSKSEALIILTKELEDCKHSRNELKTSLEQSQDKFADSRLQYTRGVRYDYGGRRNAYREKDQNLIQLICDMKEQNKKLEGELESYKQKLKDSKDDITLLRGQIARQRVGMAEEGLNTRVFTVHDREELINQLEILRQKLSRLEKDLQQVLDEKEELVVERDVYKHKVERLNTELNYLLRGDHRRIVDIDALLMENRYLRQHMHQLEQEKHQALVTVNKYKQTLEKRRTKGILKIGGSKDSGMVINQKQVEDLLVKAGNFKVDPNSPSLSYKDLHHLASALYENLNDKSIALAHQKKTNKILGSRVAELEKKLRTLETAGFWSIPGDDVLGAVDVQSDVCPVLSPTEAAGTTGAPCTTTGSGRRSVDMSREGVIERLHRLHLLPPDLAPPTATAATAATATAALTPTAEHTATAAHDTAIDAGGDSTTHRRNTAHSNADLLPEHSSLQHTPPAAPIDDVTSDSPVTLDGASDTSCQQDADSTSGEESEHTDNASKVHAGVDRFGSLEIIDVFAETNNQREDSCNESQQTK